ncbi:hypothetical protein STIAU_1721 [Stigmatella aurantiaca DW4/3-1]|uniref:Uncharacterized protein n=1 Tax=Stigmatella aurantiaca (strain DW4/3-1) TaxID=378806 RepID=Q08UW0_STIAD|nr:hypothetical protein STIAU_1721 [Stigmatella aurantiaca DW4/3-1]
MKLATWEVVSHATHSSFRHVADFYTTATFCCPEKSSFSEDVGNACFWASALHHGEVPVARQLLDVGHALTRLVLGEEHPKRFPDEGQGLGEGDHAQLLRLDAGPAAGPGDGGGGDDGGQAAAGHHPLQERAALGRLRGGGRLGGGGALRLRGLAAQQVAHLGAQEPQVTGLRTERVHAGVERLGHFLALEARGEHQHRHRGERRAGADDARGRDAIHARQHQVHEHAVHRLRLQQRQRLLGGARGDEVVPVLAQLLHHRLEEGGAVVHHQQAAAARRGHQGRLGLDGLAGRRGPRLDQLPGALHHEGGVVGLAHVVAGPLAQAAQARAHGGLGGQEQHWHLGGALVCPHLHEQVHPVPVLQEDIEDDEIKPLLGQRLAGPANAPAQQGGEARGAEHHAQVRPHGRAVVHDEYPGLHACPRSGRRRASAASHPGMSCNPTTCLAAPRRMASRGMPKTTELASSWASVTAPERLSASMPSAPSRPMPVSRQPMARPPSSRAADSNSTSTEGRHEWRSGPFVSRSSPSLSSRWRLARASTTAGRHVEGSISPSTAWRTGRGEYLPSHSTMDTSNCSDRCITRRMGSGKSRGSRWRMSFMAAGPPVEAPMTTARAGKSRSGSGSSFRRPSGWVMEGTRAASFTRASSSTIQSSPVARMGFSIASTAPALSASSRCRPRFRFSGDEKTTMGVGQWAMMRRVSSTPFIVGSAKSSVTTSGRNR